MDLQRRHQKLIVVFARFPEAGKCKTRLIGELTAEQAAQVQLEMTQHTLDCCRKFRLETECCIQVWYTGAGAQQMRQLYGEDLEYQAQPGGDLGQRMRHTFSQAEAQGSERIVALGTDCSTLSVDLIQAAFVRLESHSTVLAPAADGGYVCIGMAAPFLPNQLDALFCNIDWGTERVLAQSVDRASAANLAVALLPEQYDVDFPEDLGRWRKTQNGDSSSSSQPPCLSIIVPVLEHEVLLEQCVASSASDGGGIERIIVGAGQSRESLSVAAQRGCQFVSGAACRASQMNGGADIATGEVLVFVHADTRLPSSYLRDIQNALSDDRVVGGAFRLQIDSHGIGPRLVERMVRLRSWLLRLPYGDQAIFVRRSTFEQLGGFPDMPIMEDYVFVRKLRKSGRIRICPAPAITSGRRWDSLGVIKTTAINQLMILGYHLGIPIERLAGIYRRKRKR